MRPDMHHLLVERGHAGTGYTRHQPKGWEAQCRFRNEEDEQLESFREPVRHPWFSENLRPLYRFLDAQVGRPWDKVYSEIRAHVNADTAVQYHILQHLYDRIAVKVRMNNDGSLWHQPEWGQTEPLEKSWHLRLYVCPRTGLIRRIKRRRKSPTKEKPPDHLPATSDDHEYRDLGGQWYEVWWGSVNQNGAWVRAIVQKRQLGYKELRKLGLRD